MKTMLTQLLVGIQMNGEKSICDHKISPSPSWHHDVAPAQNGACEWEGRQADVPLVFAKEWLIGFYIN